MKLAILLPILLLPCYLWSQEEISLFTPTGTIFGTLQVPVTKDKVPVVLLISGSGPTDRDGNNPAMKNNSLKMIADTLSSHGIASLRYDKRAIGMSKDAGIDEKELRFEDYVNDASGWISLLKRDNRFSKVIVAGHSEGSLIGMIAAANEKADGYISIAGAGRSADIVLKEQLASQPEAVRKECYSIIDSLYNRKTVNVTDPGLIKLFRPSVQPYLISWFQYDPSKEIRKLKVPVLILQGTTDIQVSTDDADQLNQAAPGSKLVIIEGMNHILKEAGEDRRENIATYSNPTLPLSKSFSEELVKFLEQFR